ncbi:DNA-cytosine methyltransferase [Stanieria cyanosphaera PCC 7437]|uniref:Cytosine-specific methyltransferase n=1 Tax=Stanieria cyanosphaera (strain ATCC 29371 / PCC 7437) TaxID=111780 RepID=K9XNN5_STAC7|nr:DNA cytosine methyltransferase [Stanieria cyanosphaera]AFZ33694.1 DNA-cytosine methyltransferase [Stanieria cyanosphaera PCC 7437]
MEKQTPTFIDLFAGIGGFRLAFEQAGYKCVYSCEIDSACQEVYFNNFGEKPKDDITKIDIEKIPDFDVLTAGFPCQPFSICGKRQGFEDTRGTLFFHICKIIEAKQPSVVLLENVKHLVHHDRGRTLDIILYSLEDLGYLVDYKILNSKDFGLPQNRERIIIFATKNKKFDFNLIETNNCIKKLEEYLCKQGYFEYLKKQEYTLIENPKKQSSGLIFVGYRTNKTTWKKGVRPNTQHLSRVHHQPNRIYSVEGVHPTIPSQETSGRFFIYIPKENKVRKLTIKECYRIMGFPNSFKIHDSVAECYKQIGNSVCIPMIYQLAVQINKQNLMRSKEKIYNHNINFYQRKPVQLEILEVAVMNHKQKLLEIYYQSSDLENNNQLPDPIIEYINVIAQNCSKQKGVYTVLITLLIHKILEPTQDIRYHQTSMAGGFSGRTIDTQYITPTLKELGLPAMAESGWLTRSLEQPYPYTLKYEGKINNKSVKNAFLSIIDFVEEHPDKTELITKLLIYQIKQATQSNRIAIVKLANPEKLNIITVINCLDTHFSYNYKTFGASKLPVIAFYAIYQRLIQEVERYKECILKDLGSHTASDRTSKTAGDIKIFDKSKKLIEAIEIKYGKPISLQLVLNAKDKILKYSPRRYYIFSSVDIYKEDEIKIKNEIELIARNHGCQVIVNGIIPTLKYYLRLITSVENFIENYSRLVEQDRELQAIHKIQWNNILKTLE